MVHVRLERQLAGLGRLSPTRPLLEALAQDMRRTDLGANLMRSGLGLSGGFLFHEVSRAFAKKTNTDPTAIHCLVVGHPHRLNTYTWCPVG